jgi:hypothetical protein
VAESSFNGLDKGRTAVRRRGGVDVFTLLVGLLALGMAVSAFVGQVVFVWPGFDPRWLLAGGAALFGILLLSNGLRRGRRGC